MAKKPSRTKAVDPVALFKILADANRYRTIALLESSKKGMLVGDIALELGMGHSAVSHLLGSLNESGVVDYRKEGRTVRYLLAATPVVKAIQRIKRTFS